MKMTDSVAARRDDLIVGPEYANSDFLWMIDLDIIEEERLCWSIIYVSL